MDVSSSTGPDSSDSDTSSEAETLSGVLSVEPLGRWEGSRSFVLLWLGLGCCDERIRKYCDVPIEREKW